jgi:hypothetical protein
MPVGTDARIVSELLTVTSAKGKLWPLVDKATVAPGRKLAPLIVTNVIDVFEPVGGAMRLTCGVGTTRVRDGVLVGIAVMVMLGVVEGIAVLEGESVIDEVNVAMAVGVADADGENVAVAVEVLVVKIAGVSVAVAELGRMPVQMASWPLGLV